MKKITVLFLIFSSHIILFAQNDVVIGKYKKIDSKILGGEVTYLEHLPSGYEKSSSNYPILLMMNANISSTFANAVAIIDRLSADRVPEMILIGISNTGVADKYWACPGDSGKVDNANKFNDFLEFELLPYIKKNYRVADYKIFFGQSNTGLFAMYSFLNKPDLFNSYIIASPSFGWCPDFYFDKTKSFLQTQTNINKELYISNGDLDIKELVLNHIDNFKQILINYSPAGLKWRLDLIKNEGHVPYTSLNDALLFFFSECTITDEMRKGSIKDLRTHFTILSTKYGFEVHPAEEVLFDMGYKRKSNREYGESIEIFKYLISVYPNSDRSYFYLGETYKENGDLDLAKESYRMTLVINSNFQQAIERLKQLEKQK